MSELKFCRICLDNTVRMHQILGSYVQDVYEKLTSSKIQEDGRQYFACYICYCQLKKCQQLVVKSQKSEELLQQILPISEMKLKSTVFLNRLSNSPSNSLMITNIELLQIPEYYGIVNTKNQHKNYTNKMMIKDEPDDDSTSPNKKPKLEEIHIFEQDEANSIESVKKENISGTQMDTAANENVSSQIVSDGKSNPVLIMDSKTCHTKALLIEHISRHKPVIIKPNKTYIQIYKSTCDEKCTESNIIENDSDIHICERPFKCQNCNYTTVRKSDLRSHIKTHTGEKPFECQYCNYTTVRKSDLRSHIKTHTGEKPFECQFCNYTCTQIGHLRAHDRTHTGEKPFKCQYCSHTFTINGDLKRHIRTHTGEKPYNCQYCHFTCARKSSLNIHIKTHTGEKPYKCQHCNYTCARKSSLNIHIKTHTGEKPYKCQYCNYTCTVNSTLKRHIRSHTGEKPYKCQYCNYTFTVNSALKRHIRTHTGEKL